MRKLAVMQDPTFDPGSAHTAIVSIPVSPAGLNCTAEIWLTLDGIAAKATSGAVAFISTGAAQAIQLPITMPTAPGNYLVNLDIASGGQLIAAYQASENVVIPSQADIRVDSVWVTPAEVNLGEAVICTLRVTNYGNTAGSKDVICSIMQGGSGLIDIHIPISLAAGETADFQILDTYGLGQGVGSFTINADDKSCTLNVLGGNIGATGIVKDSQTGLPISGATVSIMDLAEFTSVTGADGRFAISGWDYTALGLRISKTGYGTKNISVTGLSSNEIRDVGTIMLDPIDMSTLIMPYGNWVLDGNTKYVGGYGQTQVNIGFAFKNIGTGVGNGGATCGIEVFKSDGSLFLSSMNVACPSVNPGATVGKYLHFDVGIIGTYTVKTYFNGALVNTLTVTVVMAQLSVAWAPKPPANITLGQTLTAGVNVHNPSPVRVLFTIKVRSQWYANDGSAPSVVLVSQIDKVIEAGATLNFSGSFVPAVISGPAGAYIPYTHVDLTWGGYHGGKTSIYAYTNVL